MSQDIAAFVILYGPFGLFALAFGAATLLPFSSEAFLYMALLSGISPVKALISASAGNILGCFFNYALGRFAGKPLIRKIMNSSKGRWATRWIKKVGFWTIPFSWLPVIGDPIIVAAGIFRLEWRIYLTGASLFRVLRYMVIIELI